MFVGMLLMPILFFVFIIVLLLVGINFFFESKRKMSVNQQDQANKQLQEKLNILNQEFKELRDRLNELIVRTDQTGQRQQHQVPEKKAKPSGK